MYIIYKLLYFVFNTGVARIFQHGGGGGGGRRKARKGGRVGRCIGKRDFFFFLHIKCNCRVEVG